VIHPLSISSDVSLPSDIRVLLPSIFNREVAQVWGALYCFKRGEVEPISRNALPLSRPTQRASRMFICQATTYRHSKWAKAFAMVMRGKGYEASIVQVECLCLPWRIYTDCMHAQNHPSTWNPHCLPIFVSLKSSNGKDGVAFAYTLNSIILLPLWDNCAPTTCVQNALV
jgi:hypothetical protein